jgi:predicted dehydrogenase
MTLKIGIVGAGKMVQMAHLPNLIKVDGVELVAIADLDQSAAQRVANAYNIPRVYGNSQELLDGESELDGVVVVTPRMNHAEACVPILQRGIPVFMEKPLEVSLDKGREIVEACKQGKTFMVVGYNNRYDPAFLTARQMLHSGEFGEIKWARIHSFGGLWRAGGLTLGQVSLDDDPLPVGSPPKAQSRDGKTFPPELEWTEGWIHEINMARGLFGEAKSVIFASNDVPRLALVEFERTRALFEVGLILPPGCPFDCKISVNTTHGCLDLTIPAPMLMGQPTELKLTTPQGVKIQTLEYKESFTEEIIHFLRCITGHEEPHTTAEDALRDLELCMKIVESGYSNKEK